jgi:hypothetical protein
LGWTRSQRDGRDSAIDAAVRDVGHSSERSNLKIFLPLNATGYEICHPLREQDFETVNVLVNGQSRRESWPQIPFQIFREDLGESLIESDAPWLERHALIFRPKVVDKMGDFLLKYGELLPLLCANEKEKLFLYNPTQVLDALDETRSSIVRFDSGRIMMIDRYEFLAEKIKSAEIFKIRQLRVSPTFVSQTFVSLWKKSELKGLKFDEVWDSQSQGS